MIVTRGMLLGGAVGIGGNDSYTKLLLHMDGANSSTTFTDSCAGSSAHTFTALGNARISTTQFMFGNSSGFFDGSGDYIRTPSSSDFDFGSGNFTIDLWFYRSGGTGYRTLISKTAADHESFTIDLTSGNVIRAQIEADDLATFATVTGTTTYTTTGWHHVAFVRTGNTLKLFIDGTQQGGNVSFTGTINVGATPLTIGCFGDGLFQYWNGYIDEVRISKGIARWTANFTPPASAYTT